MFGKDALSYASKASKASLAMPDGIVARIDPELNETRYSNVDSGRSVADINALLMHLGKQWKVQLTEDNQATITVLKQGQSQKLLRTDRTQRISFRWLQEQFTNRQFDIINVDTKLQAAGVLTKAFDSTRVWLGLIGMSPNARREPVLSAFVTSSSLGPESLAVRGGLSICAATCLAPEAVHGAM